MTAVPIRPGLSEVADTYDGFIIDLWGVLHDGLRAYPEAVDCLHRLRERGKRIVILSNAPRRADVIAARNAEIGIEPSLADALMSSGEDAWRHLKDRPDPWYRALGRRCYHLGPDRDAGMRDGLDYDFVDDLDRADFVLNTGALGVDDTVADYGPFLRRSLDRRLAMVCANPDLEVMRGDQREICAGAIAAEYEAIGGEVRYHGKPHRQIYEACFAALGIADRKRIAAIGDSLRTDVAGAAAAGIDAIFIVGGIHGEELGFVQGTAPDAERLAALYLAAGHLPAAALPRLRW